MEEHREKHTEGTITSSCCVVCADFEYVFQKKTYKWPRMISLIFGACGGNVLDDD